MKQENGNVAATKALAQEVAKKGVTVNAVDGCNDHRIVMAFSVAAAYAAGDSVIKQAESINKTYPAFFEDFCALGGKADVISNR